MSIKKSGIYAHRASLAWHDGGIPSESVVRHKCRTKNCVNPKHLEWGTSKDNALDRIRDGTAHIPDRGEAHAWAKLTAEQAVAVYKQYALGNTSMQSIASKYGVILQTVDCIVRRKTWQKETAYLPMVKVSGFLDGSMRGSKSNMAKLTEQSVLEIRKKSNGVYSIKLCRQLARQYGVYWSTIRKLLKRETWRHI